MENKIYKNNIGKLEFFSKNRLLAVCLITMMAIANNSFGQITVVSGGAGLAASYTSLTQAGGLFFDLNATSQAGQAILIYVDADVLTEDGANSLTGAAGMWTSLTITPNPANGAARTISGTVAGNLIVLYGATNVSIDGLNSGGNALTISNLSTTGLSTIGFANDASNNSVSNCTLSGSGTAGTVVGFGAGLVTGNDNNVIANNNITAAGGNSPASCVFSQGTSAAIDNSGNTINNNNISDYFNAATSSFGILINSLPANSSSGWSITNNRLFQTTVKLYTTANTHSAISVGGGAGYTINNNTIGYADAAGAGYTLMVGNSVAIAGFPTSYVAAGTATATRLFAISCAFLAGGTVSNIQGNTVGGIALYTSSGASTQGAVCGINVTSGNVNIGTTAANIIGSSSTTGSIYISSSTTGANLTGINVNSANTVSIQNNIIGGIESTGRTSGTASGFVGMRLAGAANYTVTGNFIGNTVANNIRAGYYINGTNFGIGATATTATGTSVIYGIDASAAVAVGTSGNSLAINSNTIRGLFTSGSATTAFGISTGGTMTGTTPSVNVNSNSIGTAGLSFITYGFANSGTLTGISVTNTVATTHNVQNNDIRNISQTVAGSNTHTYINVAGGTSAGNTTNITGNTFTNLNVTTTGSVTFITQSFSASATSIKNTNNNSIVTAYTKPGAGGTVIFISDNGSSVTGCQSNCLNNTFSNVVLTGATGITGLNFTDGGTGPNHTCTGNTLTNWTTGAGAINAMNFTYINGTNNISGNTISTITGQSTITGITIGNTVATSVSTTFGPNTITGLSSTGTGGTVTGITSSNASATGFNIAGNSITSLSTTGASSTVVGVSITGAGNTVVNNNTISTLSGSGATAPVANGISVSAGTAVTLSNNSICDVSESAAINIATLTGCAVNGILLSGGTTVTAFNNRIGDLRAPLAIITSPGVDDIRGISVTSSTTSTTYKLYNNTVNLTAAAGGANFGTAAVFHVASTTATTASLDMRNNILVNNSVHNGGASAVVFRRSAGTAGMLANYASASNNNDFYPTGGGAGLDLTYNDGTATATTFALYKAAVFTAGTVAPRDQASMSVAPNFVSNVCGNAGFLKITTPGAATQLESGGNGAGLSFATDFEGDARPGPSGSVNGGASSYDVGADEFDGIPGAPTITSVSASPSVTQCTATARTISATVTPAAGDNIATVTLNYAYNGTGQAPINMTGGNPAATSVWTATLPAATPANAVVSWNVVATSLAGVSSSKNGTNYADAPLFTAVLNASASVNPVCAFSGTNVQAGSPPPAAPADATYCTSLHASGCSGDNITGVVLNTLNNPTGAVCGGTSHFTYFNGGGAQTTTLTGGSPYTISVSFGTDPNQYFGAWIDYNHDGTFAVSEFLGASPNGGANGTANVLFTVPASAFNGVTRMRVVGGNDSPVTSAQACGASSSGFGESQDYDVTITGATAFVFATGYTSFSWSDGSNVVGTTNPSTVNPSATTTYTVTATDANGCTITASTVVTANPIPSTPTSQNSTQCGTGHPTVSVTSTSGAGSPIFKWYLVPLNGAALVGESGPTLTATYTINSTTTFYVSEYDGTCESQRVAVIASVNNPDAITASSSVASICPFTNLTLSVTKAAGTNTYSYAWTSGDAGSGLSLSPTAGDPGDGHLVVQGTTSGVKIYTVTGTDGSCVTTSTVSVTINQSARIDSIKAGPSTVCSGSTVSLNVYSAGISSGPQTEPSGYTNGSVTNPTTDEELYSLTVNGASTPAAYANANGCTTPAPGAGSVLGSYSNFTTLGALTTLTAGQTYTFSVDQNECDAGTFYSNGLGMWIDYNRNGSFDPATEAVIVEAVTATGPRTISGSFTVPATALAGVTRLRAIIGEGFSGGTMLPTISPGYGEIEDWQVNVLGVVAQNPAGTYTWNPGGLSGSSVTVTPTSSTTYTVQVDDGVNCTNYASVAVTVNPLPPTPTAIPSVQCGYHVPTASVVGSQGGPFFWYLTPTGGTALAGESNASLTSYAIGTSTTFYVSETDGTCESARVAVIVTVTDPDAITASNSTPVCNGSPFTLNVSKAAGPNSYSYSWNGTPSGNSGLSGPTAGDPGDGHLAVTPLASGTYTYTVTGTDGACVTTNSLVVLVNTTPVIDSVVAVPTALCSGALVTVNEYSASIGAGPQTPPSGYCAATNLGGSCVTNVILNTLNSSPPACVGPSYYNSNAPTGANTTTLVSGQSYTGTLTLNGAGITSVWIDYNRDGVYSATEWVQPYINAATGNFTINVPTNASPGQTGMRVRSRLAANPNGSGDACLAMGSGSTEDYVINVLAIVPQDPSLTYSWSSGIPGVPAYTVTDHPTNNSAIPSTATYTVTVSRNGCAAQASVNVTVNPLPATPGSQDDAQCGSGVPTCYVIGGAGLFNWYLTPTGGSPLPGESGANLTSYSISQTTTFYVSEYDGTCESNRVAVVQSVTPPPAITVSASSPACTNTTVNLTLNNPGSFPFFTYDWTSSPSAGSGISGTVNGDPVDGHLNVNPTANGTYTYTIVASDGVCNSPASVVVSVSTPPVLDSVVANLAEVCSGGSVTLNAYSSVVGSGPQTPPSGYCVTTQSGEPCVSSVILNTMNVSVPACVTPYYNTTPGVGTDLVAGQTYPITVNLASSTIYPTGGIVSVWIDYNRDGVYSATEWVQPYLAAFTGTINITVPSNALPGVTGMRVRSRGAGNPNGSADGCTVFGSGSDENFFVNILNVVPQNPALTYSWSPGGGSTETTTVNPLNPGNTQISASYTVTVSSGGCSTTGTVSVLVNPLPPTPTASAPSTQCGTGVPTVSVSGSQGGPFNWYLTPTGGSALSGESGSSLTAYSINTNTTFYVSEYDGTCESDRVAAIANVSNPDAVTASVSAGPYCANSTITLSQTKAPGPNTYTSWSWNGSPQAGSGLSGSTPGSVVDGHLDVTPTAGGTYVYTVTATDGSCTTTATVSVTITSAPPLSTSSDLTQVCAGTTVTISALSEAIGSGPQVLPTGYCTSAASSQIDEQIFGVSLGSMSNLSQGETCTVGYTDYTGSVAAPTVTAGASVPFEVHQNECDQGTLYFNGIAVYIDYNRDGDFDDAGELAYTQGTTSPCTGPSPGGDKIVSGTITIDPAAAAGLTVMRVVCIEGNANPPACGGGTYGETEDYAVNIQGSAPNPNVTFSWNPGGTGSPIIVTPSVTTTYVVTATDNSTTCNATASVVITVVNASNTPILSATTVDICESGITTLTVTNPEIGVNYNFESSPTSGGPWTSVQSGSGTVFTSGTLTSSTYFQVTASCGAFSSTSLETFVLVRTPHVISSTGGTRCGPGHVFPTVTGVVTFDWYDASTGGNLLFSNTAAPDYVVTVPSSTLWVEAIDGTCHASGRYPVSVGFTPAPAVSITSAPGTTICDNQELTLTAVSSNGGYTYEWSTNGGSTTAFTGNPYVLNPSATTTYTLTASDISGGVNNGCGNIATQVIVVNPAPPVPVVVPANPSVCSVGGCIDLSVQGATVNTQQDVIIGTGTAQNGTTTYPAPYGNYWTGDRNQNLILASELAAAGVVAGPINSIAFDVASVITPALGTYMNFTISIGGTATSSLTGTFETGLTLVYTNGSYLPVAGWNPHVFNSGTFNWNGTDNIVIETTFMQCATCPGTACTNYTNNCTHNLTNTAFNSTIDTHGDGSCAVTTTTTGTTYTQRPNMMINALTGSQITYTWNPGSLTGPSVNVCPSATTTYSVVASLTNGCTSSANVTVTYDPVTVPTPTPSSASICPGGSVNLNAGPGYSNYSWSDGASVVATTQSTTVSPSVTTTYTVTVDNGGPCSQTASVVVTVANLPAPTITTVNNDPTTFCAGSNVTLDAGEYALGNPYDSYSWSDGASVVGTSQTLLVSTAGTYTVTVSENSCSATNSVVITVNPVPPTAIITPSGPINLCDNGSNSPVTLTSDITGAGAGATIVWNQDGNPSTSTISVSYNDVDLILNGGTFGYSFQVTNIFGCSTNSNVVTVNVVPCGGPTLYAKLFLEGYYSGPGSNIMDNVVIPPTGGLLYHSGLSSDVEDVDYVTLSAMDENPPYGLIEAQTGILKRNGTIQVAFSSAVSSTGQYYIKVTHRNALETWSALPVVIGATTSSSRYDFTTAASQAYGNYQSDLLDGNWGLYSGDISDAATATIGLQDGLIESQDYGDMENAVYATLTGYVTEDITGDGIVESADYGLMENNVYFTRVLHRP